MRRKTAGNKVLRKAELNGFDWAFIQCSTSVPRLSFNVDIPNVYNTLTIAAHFKDTT